MHTLEELHAHYRAVRARINNISKFVEAPKAAKPKPELQPQPVVIKFTEPLFINPSDQIIYHVAQKHCVSVAEIKGSSRKQVYVHARREAAYRLREERNLTLNQIGSMLGHKDHTTILHAIKSHKKGLAKRTATLSEPSLVSSDP